MSRIGIIGSGNVGANAAFFVAERGIGDVTLYDIEEGLGLGKSLDIMQAASVRKYRTRVGATSSLDGIESSDILVIAAGVNRSTDLNEREIFLKNRAIVESLTRQFGSLSPQCIVIVATEPVDVMTALFYREASVARNQVMGIGGIVESTRLRFEIARELDISPEDAAALVIGQHGQEMVCPVRFMSVSGIPLSQLCDNITIKRMVEEAKKSEGHIVDLSKRSGSFYTPAAAIADLVDAIHCDLKKMVSVSIPLEGEYGLSGGALSLPVFVGKHGIEKTLTPKLTAEELEVMRRGVRYVVNLLEGDQT